VSYLRNEFQRPGIYLVPVRLAVALVWLWTFAARIVEPGWRGGDGLTAFFTRQLDDGRIVFPEYRTLIAEGFVPHAAVFGWVFLAGHLVVGVALLLGAVTNAALLAGIAIGLNLILAGSLELGLLAIVVQTLLLLTNAGAILGIDEWLGRLIRTPILVAQPDRTPADHPRAWVLSAFGVVAALAVACYAAFYAAAWKSPDLFHDPAAVLAGLAGLVAAWCVIGLIQAITNRSPAGHEVLTTGTPGWPVGWEPAYVVPGDFAPIDHLGTADLEWTFRSPLPEWSAGTAWRRQG
jgi:hypothetical protein